MEPGHDKMKEENHVQEQRKDSSVQIANPIYDVVFKFLLDDNEIEKVLSVFDVTQGKTHFFDIDEHEYPEEHQDIIRRLRQACSEKQIRDTMICEDEVLAELADMERAIANKDKELDEKVKELNSQKKEHAATLQRAVKKLAEAMDISEDEANKMLTS